MRRLVCVMGASLVGLALGGAPAWADNGPHQGFGWTADQTYTFGDGSNGTSNVGTDRCATCHRAHTAKGPTLLVASDQVSLCFSCHGTAGVGASTDVQDGKGFTGAGGAPDPGRTGGAGALRGGGFEFALIDTARPVKTSGGFGSNFSSNQHIYPLAVGQPTTSAHNVTGADVTAWGNGPFSATATVGTTVQLSCVSCHDPHGNRSYRILRAVPEQSGATTGVSITDATTKVYVTNDYWESGDPYAPPVTVGSTQVDAFSAKIALWCSTCHTRYKAGALSTKTPSGDAVFMYRHRSDALSRLPNAAYPDLAGTTKVEGGGGRNCITCHVAHGSNATMGPWSAAVEYPDGSSANKNQEYGELSPATPGDSRLLRVDSRAICLMCHNV